SDWSAILGGSSTLPPAHQAPWDVRLRHRATRWTLLLAALTVLALIVTWLLRHGSFAIQRIKLDAELHRTSVATIRANALPRLEGNFFTMDLQAARRAFESVPWVRRAEVQRHWPGQLRVHILEHKAVALWESTDSRERRDDRLVGQDGSVFQANPGDVEDDNLPLFRGPEGSSGQLWALYRPLAQVLAPIGRLAGGSQEAGIRLLQLSNKGSWSAELDTGARLELGRGTPAEVMARTETFVRTLPQAVAPFRRPVLYADLRHAEGYALRLAGISTTAAAPAKPAPPAPRPSKPKP
ncbi:MAG: cell division protein FtsQ/DivIB, partial [Betaproteobacteria bacterium]